VINAQFLTGSFSNFTIPHREHIEKYSESLLGDGDFSCYEYGDMVYKTIEEFTKIYPDLKGLYINQARCLYKLSGHGFLTSFFPKSNDAEETYLSLCYDLALKHPDIPEIAWYVAAHIHSHAFTSIATNHDSRIKAIEFYKSMWEKMPGNKYVLAYYTKSIKNQLKNGFCTSAEKDEYNSILNELSAFFCEENDDAIISYCESCVSLLYGEDKPDKRRLYFSEILKMYEKNSNIDIVITLFDYALMDCLVKDRNDSDIS
jgi:hypothetical protein